MNQNFTFHDVSIKSDALRPDRIQFLTLHSTMFLLNLALSIRLCRHLLTLHSTMFLLNLVRALFLSFALMSFTFHDVSIKSSLRRPPSPDRIHLYIPRCFY